MKQDTIAEMFDKPKQENLAEEASKKRQQKKEQERKAILNRGSEPIQTDIRLQRLQDLTKKTQKKSITQVTSQKLIKYDLLKVSPMVKLNFKNQLVNNHFPNRV